MFIPQTHRPGQEAEVDFGEVTIRLRGELVTCYLFCFRMSFSGKAVHRVSLSAGQEAFFEGHLHALRVLGGVPTGKVRYDNLRSAVMQVVGFTRARKEAERWTIFRSHLGLEAFYYQPGIEGAHEKGGVEGQVGWFRRNHLVPVPEVDSIAELNEMTDAADAADDHRRIGSRPRTIGEMFAVEQRLLRPLPDEEFETGRWFSLRVDRYSQVSVRTNKYSVPVRSIGRSVRVLLHASELVVYDGGLRSPGTNGCRRRLVLGSNSTTIWKGGPAPQTRCITGSDHAGTGTASRQVHPDPRSLVGRSPQNPR